MLPQTAHQILQEVEANLAGDQVYVKGGVLDVMLPGGCGGAYAGALLS